MASEEMGQSLDWDGSVEDSGGFELLEPGCYPFEVKRLERERFEGSAKMAACPRAKLTLELTLGGRTATIVDRLLLNTKMQWRISRFFEALGYEKDAEGRMPMHWNEVEGKTGWLRLKVREYRGNDGSARKSNDVEEYVAASRADEAYREYESRFAAPAQQAAPVPRPPMPSVHPGPGAPWSL